MTVRRGSIAAGPAESGNRRAADRIEHEHVLVVGGTGMLFAASMALTDRCRRLTSVARTERSLGRLDAALSGAACMHHLLPLDWSAPEAFLDGIARHVQSVGPPSLAVVWVHADALGPAVAAALAGDGMVCDFYQVRGSAVADSAAETPATADLPPCVRYRQVILGFRAEGGSSRWLSDAEISRGVLAAIERAEPVAVVGRVRPWSRRPR